MNHLEEIAHCLQKARERDEEKESVLMLSLRPSEAYLIVASLLTLLNMLNDSIQVGQKIGLSDETLSPLGIDVELVIAFTEKLNEVIDHQLPEVEE